MQSFMTFFNILTVLCTAVLSSLFTATVEHLNSCQNIPPQKPETQVETFVKHINVPKMIVALHTRPFLAKSPTRTTKRGKRSLQMDIEDKKKTFNVFSALVND